MLLLMDINNLLHHKKQNRVTRAFDPAQERFFCQNSLKFLWNIVTLNLTRSAWQNYESPNFIAYDLQTRKRQYLLSRRFYDPERPLCLNFGCLTSPVFIEHMPEWRTLVQNFKHSVDFSIVYVEESHSPEADYRFITSKYKGVKKATSIYEKIAAAEILQRNERPNCNILVDNMCNELLISFAAASERLCVIYKYKIYYLSHLGPWNHNLEEVRAALNRLTLDGRRVSLTAWNQKYGGLTDEFSHGNFYGKALETEDAVFDEMPSQLTKKFARKQSVYYQKPRSYSMDSSLLVSQKKMKNMTS